MNYECVGCGQELSGPPDDPPAFEVEIESYDCDTCEFVREDVDYNPSRFETLEQKLKRQ